MIRKLRRQIKCSRRNKSVVLNLNNDQVFRALVVAHLSGRGKEIEELLNKRGYLK